MKQKQLYCFCFLFLFWNLHTKAQPPRLVLPIGHTDNINTGQFSPDGKIFLSTSWDKTVKLWDAATGALLVNFTAHKEDVQKANFSPDGKFVLSIDADGIAKIWYKDGTVMIDTLGGSENVNFASFLPGSSEVIYAAYDSVFICSVYNREIITRFYTGYHAAHFLSPNGKLLLTRQNKIFKVWDAHTGLLTREFADIKGDDYVLFFNDNKALLFWEPGYTTTVKSLDNTTTAWDEMARLLREFGEIRFLAIDKSRQQLAVITLTGQLYLIDILSGEKKLFFSLEKESSFVAVCFSQDAQKLITVRNAPAEVGKIFVDAWLIKNTQQPLKLNSVSLNGLYLGLQQFSVSSNDRNLLAGGNDPKDLYLLDINEGSIVSTLGGHTNNYYYAEFNPQGNKIVTASSHRPVVWNYKLGRPDSLLEESVTFRALFNPTDGHMLVLNGEGVSIINTALPGTKKKIRYSKRDAGIYNAVFSANGKRALFWDAENEAVVVNVQSGKVISQSGLLPKDTRFGGLSGDGKKVLAVSNDSLLFFNAETWDITLLHKINLGFDVFKTAAYCSGGDKVITSTYRGNIYLVDVQTGKPEDSIAADRKYLQQVHMSPDGKKVIAITNDHQLILFDWTSHQKKKLQHSHESAIKSVQFSYDGKYFVSASDDNTCKLWESASGNLLVTFFSVDTLDYFTGMPDGYYLASANAAKLLHYVTKDLKVISFEQLDVKYNRPDKVLEAIGNTDTALIKSYRKAWEKRIKKLGIDTTQFRDGYSVLEADIVNRDSIDYEQKTGTLRLHIKGMDSTYQLDRFNVWVNESPLFGQRGISIKKKNSKSIDTTITIKFSQGENRIETSITNVNGTESYRMPLYVNYTPAVKQKEMIRFVGIGIDQFTDNQYNLQYSSKDIRDLAVKLKEKYKDDIVIDTLFNENVTVEKVKSLKQKLQATSVNDKVIISYSGHGLLSKDYDYYLSTYSVNFNNPEEKGLPYDELENLLDSIPARKKLMLIDACHSGEVDKEEGIAMQKIADSLGLSKGIDLGNSAASSQHVGLKNSFELMQSLFVNVGKSTGATIISAAAGNQFALERGDLKNGVFTYSLLEAMNKYPTIKISELKKIVGERVEQLTNGMQKPTSRNEAIAVDWEL